MFSELGSTRPAPAMRYSPWTLVLVVCGFLAVVVRPQMTVAVAPLSATIAVARINLSFIPSSFLRPSRRSANLQCLFRSGCQRQPHAHDLRRSLAYRSLFFNNASVLHVHNAIGELGH